MKKKHSARMIILAAVLCMLSGFTAIKQAEALSPTPKPTPTPTPTSTPFPTSLPPDQSADMKQYHLEVWYQGGRLPIISSYNVPLETIAENNYIPTVTIEDTDKKPYLVNYEAFWFSSLSERTFFYEPGEDGFHRCEDERGRYVEKLEALKPGDYLMNINIWAMVYDVVYSFDCYMHIVIPGAENASVWPVATPTAPPVSEPVPDRFMTPDGDWITPVPALRSDPGLLLTPEPPTPTPTSTPMP